MSAAIPVVWPDDVSVEVVTPLAFLRTQAGDLGPRTKGVLDAEVSTAATESRASHRLQLIAPALGGFRRTILTAVHAADEPYPVRVQSACYEVYPERPDLEDEWPTAATYGEFVDLVRRALHSNEVRSVIQLLIARSNEAARPTEEGGREA